MKPITVFIVTTGLNRSAFNQPRCAHVPHDVSDQYMYSEQKFDSIVNDNVEAKRQSGRRLFLTASCNAAMLLGAPDHVHATKGAAEYDFEFYIRDLVFGNKPEGNLPASNGPPLSPPRTLRGPLLNLLLDDELQSCVPVIELAKVSGSTVTEISNKVKGFRKKVQPAFSSRYQWKEEAVFDEYYFDCTAYSLWKVASQYISDYTKRDQFIRAIGNGILNELIVKEIISRDSAEILIRKSNKPSLTETIPCANEILQIFQDTEFCASFRLGDKNDDIRSGDQLFDDLDDQEILNGGTVNCLVSVLRPATLGGSLQITGEGSRFAPDFIGPTLAAVWERVGAGAKNDKIDVTWESYFVDPVYRPNPKDFFPDERLYQFTIASKKA